MNAERWGKVCRLFEAALERPPEERAAFLEKECRGDKDLESEVESLLASDEGESFLDRPGPGGAAPRGCAGPYELLGEIGRGGMGVVYEAVRRDQGFERTVAVKLVKRGMDTDFILRRFESERRILAELDHPNIARVLDGGETSDGLPYFVMELIEGKNLLEYCEEMTLDTQARLALFRQVCSAVTYAHQRLVIHRDIKPVNILVTEEGVPKLLDFGIAKLLAAGESADRTETALRVLTPEYASPEQILGRKITTSSDVYSLGVVLYELLTGQRPYRVETHRPEEITAAVLGQQPERPSAIARIHRDLDSIVLMSLRKEPDRRYASAEQLSEDVRRHLDGLPVIARKDTLGYRARKFLGRHRTVAAAAALLLLSLVGGIAATARQARIAQRERQRAERRLDGVRKLTNSFLFEFHDAIKNLAGSTPAREIVVRRALEYLGMLAAEGPRDTSLQRELATAYQKVGDVQGLGGGANLGDSAGALESYRAAQRILENLTGGVEAAPRDLEDLAWCHFRLSKLFILRLELAEALKEGRKSLSIREGLLKSGAAIPRLPIRIAEGHHHIGLILHMEDDKPGALAELGRAQEAFDAALRVDPSDLDAGKGKAGALFEIASVLQHTGDPRAARARAEEARSIEESLSAAHPTDARLKLDLAMTLHDIGEYDADLGDLGAAIARMREAVAMIEDLTAADPRNAQAQLSRGYCARDLASLLVRNGEPAEALRLDRAVMGIMENLLQEDPANGYARRNLARAYAGAGDALSPAVSPARLPGRSEAERWRESRAWYQRSLEVWNSIRTAGKLGTDAHEPETIAASLARSEKALNEASRPGSE